MSPRLQERFDRLLQDVLDELPQHLKELVEQVPIVVMDRPTPKMVKELISEGTLEREEDADELCGLHTGVGITDRSIEDPDGWGVLDGVNSSPEQIHIFREGVVSLAGGWETEHADDDVYEEIRITVLHEIGHHFGLDEDDLDELGYG